MREHTIIIPHPTGTIHLPANNGTLALARAMVEHLTAERIAANRAAIRAIRDELSRRMDPQRPPTPPGRRVRHDAGLTDEERRALMN